MLTTKKRRGITVLLFLVLATLFSGCKPPGPRALLDGKRLLDHGNYEGAIARFETATSLLNTNAQAWNYLGVAYHRAGQTTNALQAYQKAIALDQNLLEARYNLGSFWLEQGRADLARTEFTIYTLRRPASAEGWMRLGAAQMRARDLDGAEKSFRETLRLSPNNAEALNGLGMLQMQRNRPREAAQFFMEALKHETHYAPALLNLAIVSHQHLNQRPFALQKYREYLAIVPNRADWQEVSATVRALEQELAAPPRVAAPTNAVVAVTSAPAPAPTNVPPRAVTNAAPRPAVAAPTTPVDPPVNVVREPRVTAPAPLPTNMPVVRLPPEQTIRPATEVAPPQIATPASPVVNTTAVANATSPETPAPVPEQRRGFLQRMNPRNLFSGGSSKTAPTANETGATGNIVRPTTDLARVESPAPGPATIPRYRYQSPPKPGDGDRAAAERVFAQAAQAQQANRLPEAIQGYRQAAQLDPGYFEAHYHLGLAAMRAGNLTTALTALETALAIYPNRADARLYFAQTLKQANYPLDAVNELERLLASYPNDARAHLALGNLYAQQFRQTEKARQHYQKVLELDPRIEQAPAIREWLWDNRR